MRHALYWELMEDEFGSVRAASLHRDLALSTLGSRTPSQALESGHGPREVWAAVCDAAGVPDERRLGRDKPRSSPL